MSESTQRPGGRRSRLDLAMAASSLLVLLVSANVAAAGPDTSTSSAAGSQTPAGDGATRIHPNPHIVALQKTSWDHVKVSADGKRVVVYFWMGVQACDGLGQVDVTRQDGQLKIQLWTGIRRRAIGMVCPELAQIYKTVIYLNRPIIVGGVFWVMESGAGLVISL